MSDDAVAEVPVADATPPQEGTPEPAQEAVTTPQDTPAEQPQVDDSEIKRLRKEAAQYRTELRKAEAELQARKEAEMSEAERLAKRAEDAEKAAQAAADRIKAANLKAAVVQAATDAGISPDLAAPLVKDSVEFDEDGEPTNVTDLLKGLAESHPELVKRTLAAGQTPNAGKQGPPAETDEQRLARIWGNRGGEDPTRGGLGGGVYMPEDGSVI